MKLTKIWEADFDRYYDLVQQMPSENGFINDASGLDRNQLRDFVEEKKENSFGRNLKDGYVPDTKFIVENNDGEYVGFVNFRHYLNNFLRNGAGHIGYGIAPKYRGKGYATEALKLALQVAKERGITEAYLSVNKNNAASLAVQMKCGGYIHHEDELEYYTRIPLEEIVPWPNVKAILFDYDGTLGDRTRGAYDTYVEFLQTFGIAEQLHDETELECVLQHMMNWDQYGNFEKEFILQQLKDTYGLALDVDRLTEWWVDHLCMHEKLYPRTIETLDYLKGKYKLGMITNGFVESQNMKLDNVGIRDYFDTIVIGGQYNTAKPNKKLYQIALEQLGVQPDEAVFVGDSYMTDIIGAYRTGMRSIWLWHQDGRINSDGIKRINEIEDLMDIL